MPSFRLARLNGFSSAFLALFALGLAMSLVGCNKDQQLERRLDGTWDIENYTSTFPEESVISCKGQYSFKKDGTGAFVRIETRDVSGLVFESTTASNFRYELSEKGKRIVITTTSPEIAPVEVHDWAVESSDKKKQRWRQDFSEGTRTLEMKKFEKK